MKKFDDYDVVMLRQKRTISVLIVVNIVVWFTYLGILIYKDFVK